MISFSSAFKILTKRGFKNLFYEFQDWLFFDFYHKLDTQKRINGNKSYVPSYFKPFKEIIKKLKTKKSETLLIDIGAGKGRIAIGSILIGFQKTIAIEKNREVFRILKKNTDKINIRHKIILLNNDALDFRIMHHIKNKKKIKNIIFYAYHPFNFRKICNLVEKNFLQSSKAIRSNNYFIYYGYCKNKLTSQKYDLIIKSRETDITRVMSVYKRKKII